MVKVFDVSTDMPYMSRLITVKLLHMTKESSLVYTIIGWCVYVCASDGMFVCEVVNSTCLC